MSYMYKLCFLVCLVCHFKTVGRSIKARASLLPASIAAVKLVSGGNVRVSNLFVEFHTSAPPYFVVVIIVVAASPLVDDQLQPPLRTWKQLHRRTPQTKQQRRTTFSVT